MTFIAVVLSNFRKDIKFALPQISCIIIKLLFGTNKLTFNKTLLYCSVLSAHNTGVRHELEDQIANQEKGYPLRLIKRKISILKSRQLHVQFPDRRPNLTVLCLRMTLCPYIHALLGIGMVNTLKTIRFKTKMQACKVLMATMAL